MADRSVSVSMRLRVAEYLLGAEKAKRANTDLSRSMTETGATASKMRQRLEAATKALPKIKIDADSSPAELKFAELRQRMEALSQQRIGIDVDAAAALTEIQTVEAELGRLQRDEISIDVRADIGSALAELGAVQAEIRRLATSAEGSGQDAGGAFARAFRSRLEAGLQALPKARIDADSSPAQAKIAEIRNRMEALSSKTIGIDIDAGVALAEMRAVQAELQAIGRSGATVDVRADATTAMAELAAVGAEVSSLNGKNANVSVDANVAGALAKIALVGAALAALPAAVTIGAGIAGLGAAFGAAAAGAGAFAAVAMPAMGRVNEAVKEMGKSTGGAGGATKSLAQTQAEAASKALQLAQAQDRVKDALRSVKDAQDDVKRAQRDLGQVEQDVSRVIADAAQRHADALRRVSDAERQVGDAQRDALRAQQAVNDARKEAARDLQDLGNRLIDTNLDLRGANLDLIDAQGELNRVMSDKNATDEQKKRAQLNYDRAVQRVNELKLAIERLNAEQKQADKDGVEGSKKVTDAKDALAQANQRVADAQRSVMDAQRDAAKVDEDNSRRIADAQQKVVEAHEKVADAQRKVADAQRDAVRAAQALKVQQLQAKTAMEQAGGAAGGAATKFDELSKKEQQMAKDLKRFQDGYKEWQRSLEGDVFPAIKGGLDLVSSLLPRISPLVKSAAGAFVDLEKDVKKALDGQIFNKLLWDLNTQIPGAIDGLGNSFINIGTGLAGIIDAFLPFTPTIVGGIEEASLRFSEWGQQLQNSPEFHDFIQFVKENAPVVWDLIKNIAGAGKDIVTALAPLGVGSLAGLNLLASIVRGMDPEHIRLIALAILAVKLAQGGLKIASFWGDLSGKVDALNGKMGGLKGTLKGGAIGLGIGAIATSATLLRDKLTGLNPDIDTLAKGMQSLVNGGKGAPELLDQVAGKSSMIDRSQWESFANIANRLTSDNTFYKLGTQINGAFSDVTGVNLDSAVTRVQNIDKALAVSVSSGHGADAAKMFDNLAKMAAEAEVPVDKLKTLFPEYTDAVSNAVKPTNDAATAISSADQKLKDFSTSLTAFSGRTDALTALRNMEQGYKDAKDAIDAASGKLDINAQMTDKQRDAVIKAREQFGGYLQKIREGADAQATLSGKATDATKTIVEQLPKMFELAGSNKEAKAQVLKLAEAYGISRSDAIKAASGAKGLKEILDKIKSKQIRIDMETKAAEDALKRLWEWQKKILGLSNELPDGIAAPKKPKNKADGGVDFNPFADGGIQRFAAGAENHVAQIAPANTIRVWAEPETGGESYIPLAESKRARSTEILAATAGIMGFQLMPAGKLGLIAMANGGLVAGSTPVMSTGSATGGLSVSIDNLGAMTASLDQVSNNLNERLAGATGLLSATIGETGTLTKTISSAGQAAGKVATTTQQAATSTTAGLSKLTTQMAKLTISIDKLAAVLAKAGSAATTSTKTTATKKPAPKPKAKTDPNDVTNDPGAKRDPNDVTYDRNPPKKKPVAKKPTNQIDGYAGAGSFDVSDAAYAGATAGVDRVAALIGQTAGAALGAVMAGAAARSLPINDRSGNGVLTKTMSDTGHLSATLQSRQSKPQMGNPVYYSGVAAGGPASMGRYGSNLASEAAGGPQKPAPTLHIENYHPPQNASPRFIAEEMSFIGRRS